MGEQTKRLELRWNSPSWDGFECLIDGSPLERIQSITIELDARGAQMNIALQIPSAEIDGIFEALKERGINVAIHPLPLPCATPPQPGAECPPPPGVE